MTKARLSERSRIVLSIATIIIAYFVGIATGFMLNTDTPIDFHPDNTTHPHNECSDTKQNCETESTDSEATKK